MLFTTDFISGCLAKSGSVVLGVGGGHLKDVMFMNNVGDATFSFFAGYDRRGAPTGNFLYKRVFPSSGVRAMKSTEITDVQVGTENGIP